MTSRLYLIVAGNRSLVLNAGSLVSSTAITSGLGFVYWWQAAQAFPPGAVGFAATAISTMNLLGFLGTLGVGNLLINELPRQPGREISLILPSLIPVAITGGGLGILAALTAPILSAELRPLAESIQNIALFALGVALMAVSFVVDQALIGLLRGDLQVARNAFFALTKIGALMAVSGGIHPTGLTILSTWVIGSAVSLTGLLGVAVWKVATTRLYWPQWGSVRAMGHAALGHYALNVALQGPSLALPALVTALFSTTVNAYFYTAWMVAGLLFVGPAALTISLNAVGSRAHEALAPRVRFTLLVAVVSGLIAQSVLLVTADWILGIFGAVYAEEAGWCLRILGFGIFPLIIRNHYITISRIHSRQTTAAAVLALGGCLELLLAALGGSMGGLLGLGLGWVAALWLEAAMMAPMVYRTAIPGRASSGDLVLQGPSGKRSE